MDQDRSFEMQVDATRRGSRPAFNEMYREDGSVRPAYAGIEAWIGGSSREERGLTQRVRALNAFLTDAIKLALIAMDSTLRSNLSVGLPIDSLVYRGDALAVSLRRRIREDDEYFRMIRERWSAALREAYRGIPNPDWLDASVKNSSGSPR